MVRCARETGNGEGVEPQSASLDSPLLGGLDVVLGHAGAWGGDRRRMIVETLR